LVIGGAALFLGLVQFWVLCISRVWNFLAQRQYCGIVCAAVRELCVSRIKLSGDSGDVVLWPVQRQGTMWDVL
jgi:hypothetical protein